MSKNPIVLTICSLALIIVIPNPFSSYNDMKQAQQNLNAANSDVVGACQNLKGALVNETKDTSSNNSGLINDVEHYNNDCGQFTGQLNVQDIQNMVTANNGMVIACQDMKNSLLNLAQYTTASNDPQLAIGLEQYNNRCTQFTGPLNIQ